MIDGSLIPNDHVEFVLRVLEVMEDALEGDGSTNTMPDVSPADAARWIYSALNKHGYLVVKYP